MTTGLVNWHFQARDYDNWNGACGYVDEPIEVSPVQFPGFMWNMYDRCPEEEGPDADFGASPILLPNGNLLAGDKAGTVYLFDPDAAIPGVNNSPLLWVQDDILTGGSLGGIHWGMAVDETTVYVAGTDLHVLKASKIDDSIEDRTTLVDGATPGIYALNLSDGSLRWEAHPKHDYQGVATDSLYSASLTVTNDILFAASLDGVVKAFLTTNGAELWSLDLAYTSLDVNGVTAIGGTIDSVGVVVADDTILINSGYNSFGKAGEFQAGAGNTLFILDLAQ
jgi:polyvinyl alcohol dehydrogenase (cytochrome)